jgi:peptidylprolyl isomerase
MTNASSTNVFPIDRLCRSFILIWIYISFIWSSKHGVLCREQDLEMEAKASEENLSLGENNHDLRSENKKKKKISNPPRMDPIPMLPKVTHKVFLDVEMMPQYKNTEHANSWQSPIRIKSSQASKSIDKESKSTTLMSHGRIVFGLFGTHVPSLVQHFQIMCDCSKPQFCYRQSRFHRIIPNFMIQGGDVTNHDGTGGIPWKDDSVRSFNHSTIHFHRPFLLASTARKTIDQYPTSQFFVTTVKTQWLNDQHVIMGIVLEGEDVIRWIEAQGTNGGMPKANITIVHSGSLELTMQDQIPIPVSRQSLITPIMI